MNIKEILKKIDFPEEGIPEIAETFSAVKDNPLFLKAVKTSESGYENAEETEKLIKGAFPHPYRVLLCVLLALFDMSKSLYAEKGHPEEIFWESVRDISLKAPTCKKTYGEYGTNWFPWQLSILYAVRIKIGRLQYELLPFAEDDTVIDGVTLRKGEIYVNCHIPEDGPLTPESVDESLNKAAKYFGYEDYMPVTCTSWLILPEYQGVCFSEDSNTYKFVKRFTPVKTYYEDDFEDSWRIFYTENFRDTASLPADTSLQKRFKEYIENGGKFGETLGAFIRKIK